MSEIPKSESMQEQFHNHVEKQKENAAAARDHRITQPETPRATKDVAILATAFQREAEHYKDMARGAESPAIRWYANGAYQMAEFLAARIREIIDPTVTISPELMESAVEATFQSHLSLMRALDAQSARDRQAKESK